MKEENEKVILLFDGICNFCNSAVNFILPRDKQDRFRFAALQSLAAKPYISKYGLDPQRIDSVVLIENGTAYYRSDAALRCLKNMGGVWVLLYFLVIVPAFIRDPVYNWIAKNRYKWFGKKETCRLPEEPWKNKFLI
jgi:predicted DCC family thiol-disulfide oxidoreductase YuxK